MGRRSINTTKSGKYMNPTDQARKEARKKELKKNKKQRQMVRAAVLKGKDPGQLIEEMEKIDEMEYNVFQPSPLNEKVLKEKRKKLKETFDRVMRLYHNDDPELWAELKRKEVEYEKRRNKKVQYYESVRHAQTVQVDEIPLPMSETPQPSSFNVPASGRSLPPPPPQPSLITPSNTFVSPQKNINTIQTDVITELTQEEEEEEQEQQQPAAIITKKKIIIKKKRDVTKKTKKAPQCPPMPPPDITGLREFEVTAIIRHSRKNLKKDDKIRSSKNKRRHIQEPEKMIKTNNEIKLPESGKDTLKPTSLQQRMLALSGQNIDEFMKEMEVVQMKKQQERAADLHTRLSALDKRQQIGTDNQKNISSYDLHSGDDRIADTRSAKTTGRSGSHRKSANKTTSEDFDDALSITSCDETCSEYNGENSDSCYNWNSNSSGNSSDSSEISDEEFGRNKRETKQAKLLKLKLKEMFISKSLESAADPMKTTKLLTNPNLVRQTKPSILTSMEPPQRPPQHIITKSQLSQHRQPTNVPPPLSSTSTPITQFIKLPSGPPPPPVGVPPGLMYRPPPPIRPTNMPMGIRMPPGPPPGPRPGSMHGTGNPPPRLGIRMPPGPPPGIPPARLMQNNPHGQKPTINPIIGNTLTAGPLLTKDTKGMTTITAKPQIRNLSADVTRFVPSALRIKREDKKQIKPRPFIQPIRHYDQPKGTTKDDAYMQFMKEMQGLL